MKGLQLIQSVYQGRTLLDHDTFVKIRESLYDTFQSRVRKWMNECFDLHVRGDVRERGDRLLEETLELLQSHGYDKARVATLVEYVYGRPVGDPPQEVGGVMVTLAAYCGATGLDMHQCGETELERIWTKIPEIRAKQASKRGMHTPLPVPPELSVAERALQYVFGNMDVLDWKRIVDEKMTPPWPLPEHVENMGLAHRYDTGGKLAQAIRENEVASRLTPAHYEHPGYSNVEDAKHAQALFLSANPADVYVEVAKRMFPDREVDEPAVEAVRAYCGEEGFGASPCDKPPAGWRCTRAIGHDGPCAAVETGTRVMGEHHTIGSQSLKHLIDSGQVQPDHKGKP